MNLFRRKKEKPAEFYNSIKDCVQIWIDIHEKGTLEPLIKSGTASNEELRLQWHKLNNEFIQKFGIEPRAKRLIETRKRLCLELAGYLATGDKNREMNADILKKELEEDSSEGTGKAYFSDITATLEEFIGFRIDTKEVSIEMYYTYLERIKTKNKALTKLNS